MDSGQHDPLEGVSPEGFIVTGADRSRVPAPFESVLEAAIDSVAAGSPDNSLYLYGSVATGMAVVPTSDVDLVTIGLSSSEAAGLSRVLSERFSHLCRSVDIGAGQASGFDGDDWEAYGNRVFLRHYCAHLAGRDHRSALPGFAADVDAARGFNGDIAQLAERWRADLAGGADPIALSRRIGRKSLFAVAGLVSSHDRTWTTDRRRAATRWAEVEPDLAGGLRMLLGWSAGEAASDGRAVEAALNGVVARIVESFAAEIGVWDATAGT